MDLKIKDVSELLQVSETTVRRWIATGKIPAYRLHHQYRFSRIEIENWMMQCKLHPIENEHALFGEKQIYPPVSKNKFPSKTVGSQSFSLYRAIHKGGVYYDVEAHTKEQLIRSVMEQVSPVLGVDPEGIAEMLLDRENLMPTALNSGIAVPHTRDFLLPQSHDCIATVFPKKPIEWGALDGKPVHTLFFLFSSSDKRHLHLLAKLAHFSSQEKALSLLEKKPEKDVLLSYIKEWEASIRQQTE